MKVIRLERVEVYVNSSKLCLKSVVLQSDYVVKRRDVQKSSRYESRKDFSQKHFPGGSTVVKFYFINSKLTEKCFSLKH